MGTNCSLLGEYLIMLRNYVVGPNQLQKDIRNPRGHYFSCFMNLYPVIKIVRIFLYLDVDTNTHIFIYIYIYIYIEPNYC